MKNYIYQFYNEGFATTFYLKPVNYLKKNIRNNKNFSIDDIYNILNDLQNTKKSMSVIGEQYGIHRDLVSKINKGQAYVVKNFSYPAR